MMYVEKCLIQRLHTLIQHEKEAPFRELYQQSLDQLERKYAAGSPSSRQAYPLQTHVHTRSQSRIKET